MDFFIDGVYVDPMYRGKGLSIRLYEEALALAREEGRRGLISSHRKRNEGSDSIWEKLRDAGHEIGTVEIEGDRYDVVYA